MAQEIAQGEQWSDPGASAVDDVDGPIPVTVDSSSLDTNVPGEYVIRYVAQDNAGNVARVSRVVRVIPATSTLSITNLGDGQIDMLVDGQALSCLEDCEYELPTGTVVEMTGVDSRGMLFDEWENCDAYDLVKCRLTLTRDRRVLAIFISEQPTEYNPDAIFLNEAQLRALHNYEADSNQLSFDNTVDFSQVEQGAVLVARKFIVADDHPDNINIQFIRRVQAVSQQSDGGWLMTTSPGVLTDIVRRGTGITRIGQSNGPGSIRKQQKFSPGKPVANFTLINDTKVINASASQDGFTARGDVTLGGRLDLDLYFVAYAHIEVNEVYNAELVDAALVGGVDVYEPDNNLRLILDASVTTEGGRSGRGKAISLGGPYPLLGKEFYGFDLSVTFDPEAYLILDVSAHGEIPMDVKFYALAGTEYRNGRWDDLAESKDPEGPENGLSFDFDNAVVQGSAFTEVGLRLPITASLDGEVAELGATITANPFLSAEAGYDNQNTVCPISYSVDYGFRLRADWNAWVAIVGELVNVRDHDVIRPLTENIVRDPCRDDRQPPSPPTTVVADVRTDMLGSMLNYRTVRLAWSGASDNVGVSRYNVFRSSGRDSTFTENQLWIPSVPHDGMGIQLDDSWSLTAGTSYCYSIIAVDGKNLESEPYPAFAENLGEHCIPEDAIRPTDTTPPVLGEAALKVRSKSPTALELGWEAATDDEWVSGYRLFLSPRGSNEEYPVNVDALYPADMLATDIEDLIGGQEYCFVLAAYDAFSNRSAPTSRQCAAPDNIPPTAPASSEVRSIDTGSLEVKWESSTDNDEVVAYRLYHQVPAGDEQLVRELSAGELSARLEGLSEATEYCYVVRAVDYSGNVSDASAVACNYTFSSVPETYIYTAACQGSEPAVQLSIDLDPNVNQSVQVAGRGNDYVDDAPFGYVMEIQHDAQAESLSATVDWLRDETCDEYQVNLCFSLGAKLFQTSEVRADTYEADLTTGDSGVIATTQTTEAGCDAEVRLVRN